MFYHLLKTNTFTIFGYSGHLPEIGWHGKLFDSPFFFTLFSQYHDTGIACNQLKNSWRYFVYFKSNLRIFSWNIFVIGDLVWTEDKVCKDLILCRCWTRYVCVLKMETAKITRNRLCNIDRLFCNIFQNMQN